MDHESIELTKKGEIAAKHKIYKGDDGKYYSRPEINFFERPGIRQISDLSGEDSKTVNDKIDKAEYWERSGIPFDVALDLDKDLEDPKKPVYFTTDMIDEAMKHLDDVGQVNKMKSLNETAQIISYPFFRLWHNTAASFNEGMMHFSTGLDLTLRAYIGEVDTTDNPELVKKAAKVFEHGATFYEDNMEHWQKKAEKLGPGAVEEFFGGVFGHALPGLASFMLDIESGLTLPFIREQQREKEKV